MHAFFRCFLPFRHRPFVPSCTFVMVLLLLIFFFLFIFVHRAQNAFPARQMCSRTSRSAIVITFTSFYTTAAYRAFTYYIIMPAYNSAALAAILIMYYCRVRADVSFVREQDAMIPRRVHSMDIRR